jgi:hypothetical protein
MKTNCTCECEHDPCATSILERPRYFDRQIITSVEMNLAGQYWRDCLRRHNRLLHGWGVVCGARVCPVIEDGKVQPWRVTVQQGYILGPYGDEIVIDCARQYDLRTGSTSGAVGDPCLQPPDPWCSDVYVPRDAKDCLYIAVRYREFLSRPVRVPLIGCGCEESQCEYSRVRDGYEISAIEECPASHRCNDPAKTPTVPRNAFIDWQARMGFLRDCPSCPSEPWVVLARVCFESDGTITLIDNCDCRRIVVSFADYWWSCSDKVKIDKAGPKDSKVPLTPGAEAVPVVIVGSGFDGKATINLGEGFTAHDVVIGSKEITLNVDVSEGVKPGDYPVAVINPDCSMAGAKLPVTAASTETSTAGKGKVAKGKPK